MAFINGCGGVKAKVQSRSIPLTTNQQTVVPNDGYDGINKLSIDPSEILQSKTMTDRGTVTPDSPYIALSEVTVNVYKPFCSVESNDTATNDESSSQSTIELTIPNGSNLQSTPPRYIFIFNVTPNQVWSCWDGLQFARLASYTTKSTSKPSEYANRVRYTNMFTNKVGNTNYGRLNEHCCISIDEFLWPEPDNPNLTFNNFILNDDGSLTIRFTSTMLSVSGSYGQLLPLVEGTLDDYIHTGVYKVIMVWDVEDQTGMNEAWLADHETYF